MKRISIVLLVLSFLFVFFSFFPSLYEIYRSDKIPKERAFVLEHNYMFDYNFYLSRIREGIEGKWLVLEKYYNKPHGGSFFQILYLWLGKIGSIFRLSPPFIYHASRIIFGFIFLVLIGRYLQSIFKGWWSVIAFLIIVTSGSWPILVKLGESFRFATYMGWWSAVDSLQRITFLPHVLFGQIFLLLFIWYFQNSHGRSPFGHTRYKHLEGVTKLLLPGVIGLLVGIVFPPSLIVVYTVFIILSVCFARWHLVRGATSLTGRLVFVLLSFPSLLYLKKMFQVLPWSALALFDIQHRIPLPYKEYAFSLGPILPLGLLGLLLALIKKEKKLFPSIAWVSAVVILIVIFERVPEQSPLRWTEAAVHIPLGILSTYLFYNLWHKQHIFKRSLIFVLSIVIIMGLGVMGSMVLWLTDQARWKSEATWPVPIGAQLAYPLQDFMDGVYYLRDNTKREEVVLAYVTAGNFIPAYAGNFVYLGHANTPDEDTKEKIAAEFFSGKMKKEEAENFLRNENISYIYFGPQEKEIGNLSDLKEVYPFLGVVYSNNQIKIYKVN